MDRIEALTQRIIEFGKARDWEQFHNPKDVALSLVLEAGEVMEHFQWKSKEEVEEYVVEHKEEIGEELADVLYWVLLMSHDLDIDIEDALEKMASSTSTDFLRRAVWQIVNTLKAGASLKGALRSIIDDLTAEHKNRIRDYSRELNLWSLMYMLFAVAIPTIGATMLVILSSFAGIGVSRGMFIAFLALNFALQFILIGFVKSRRPVVDV